VKMRDVSAEAVSAELASPNPAAAAAGAPDVQATLTAVVRMDSTVYWKYRIRMKILCEELSLKGYETKGAF